MIYAWVVGWPLLILCIWTDKYFDWLYSQTAPHPVVNVIRTVPSRISEWWESLDEPDN